MKPPMTVEQVVALAKKQGEIHVNPLKANRSRVTSACFTAAATGKLKKKRMNCGWFIFTPIPRKFAQKFVEET